MEIYSWSWGFVFRQKIMINYKSAMFASRDVCINFGKEKWSQMRCYTSTDYTYTRC